MFYDNKIVFFVLWLGINSRCKYHRVIHFYVFNYDIERVQNNISQFSSIQSLSRVQLFATPRTAACQASLSLNNLWSLLKLMSIELVWCHPTISSSVIPFSSHLKSFPASGSFQMSQFFASGGQSTGVQLQHQSFQWIFRTDFL